MTLCLNPWGPRLLPLRQDRRLYALVFVVRRLIVIVIILGRGLAVEQALHTVQQLVESLVETVLLAIEFVLNLRPLPTDGDGFTEEFHAFGFLPF